MPTHSTSTWQRPWQASWLIFWVSKSEFVHLWSADSKSHMTNRNDKNVHPDSLSCFIFSLLKMRKKGFIYRLVDRTCFHKKTLLRLPEERCNRRMYLFHNVHKNPHSRHRPSSQLLLYQGPSNLFEHLPNHAIDNLCLLFQRT